MLYEIDNRIFDFECSYNKKTLNRNGQDWEEFFPSFTYNELWEMRDFLHLHPIQTDHDYYNLDQYDGADMIVYDYIKWWIFDLLHEGEVSKAKEVLNAALI